jgi:hypothetical protein
MDVVQAVSGYVTKMVSAGDGSGGKMKILLLDQETVKSPFFFCYPFLPSRVGSNDIWRKADSTVELRFP